MKKIKIIVNVCLYSLLAIMFAFVLMQLLTKKQEDASTVFGFQTRLVITDSMAKSDKDVSEYKIKSIPAKSLILINTKIDYSKLKVGDVLTFRYVYTSQVTITHRIINIEAKDDGYIITLEGDNKAKDAGQLIQTIDTRKTDSPNYIIGKVVFNSYFIGSIIYALQKPLGAILLVIIPCLIIIIFEIVRIINIINSKKKETQKKKEKELKAEIESLKKQLEKVNS